jgi:hypothetical protein
VAINGNIIIASILLFVIYVMTVKNDVFYINNKPSSKATEIIQSVKNNPELIRLRRTNDDKVKILEERMVQYELRNHKN